MCDRPAVPPERPATSPSSLPSSIRQVADQVENVRGLEYLEPVAPEPLSQRELATRLAEGLNRSFPRELMERRGQAWGVIGAVPPGTDLRQAVFDFAGSQIIGFYDPTTHEIVFVGSESPSPYERLTLAHELTHALDDQHFDLRRLDRWEAACRDEQVEAFVALAEGSAQAMEERWALANLSQEEIGEAIAEGSSFPGPPDSVPPFVSAELTFPYPSGYAFVSRLLGEGGSAAVDAAFRDPPVSTEQILHPERYPDDLPEPVTLPELSPSLGAGWEPIDDQEVGEGWLLTLLQLRLEGDDAAAAAAGWDGGRYRAWSDGSRTALFMETIWDGDQDAAEFAAAIDEFTGNGPATVLRSRAVVRVLFASDPSTLEALTEAAGG